MNWALSLRSLGWDIWIAEHLASDELEPPARGQSRSPQEEFWHATAEEFGFSDRQCLLIDGQSPDLEAFREFADSANMFLNYSGQFKRLDLLGPRTVKCYLDVDPGFTQLWAAVCGTDMNFDGHDLFFTIGANFHSPGLRLPGTGREWIPLVPPVPSDQWVERLARSGTAPDLEAWTTVAHWYGYNDLVWDGFTYGGKRESLHALHALPRVSGERFIVASDLEPDWEDYRPYLDGGWQLVPSAEVCRDVPSYLRFIAGSLGEIGPAKGGYVVSRGGWISDRSTIYLALGRPVVLQDTAWPEVVPPQDGLVPFTTPDEASARIREVMENIDAHRAGAARLARTVFSPAQALSPLFSKL